ncbi:Uncharacterised protein [uncultured archaeon]|nr:Uncharacterised protein [uncultured archaeon]
MHYLDTSVLLVYTLAQSLEKERYVHVSRIFEQVNTDIIIAPLLNRQDRIIHAQKFSSLNDASDLPHAISALIHNCEDIIAYDEHFRAIADTIPYLAPEDVLK